MAAIRRMLLGVLISFTALADPPSAVQVCFVLPDGLTLFSPKAKANYRALDAETYVLDLDLTLNGQPPLRLTKNGAACVRAWLPAAPVRTIEARFDRTALNLAPQTKAVDLKLKPDLWYDAGLLTVSRDRWVHVSSGLPGRLTLERLSAGGRVTIDDFTHVPSGTYRVSYEAPPPPAGSCQFVLKATGLGTIGPDRHPELFASLVEAYRTEWLPEVAKARKLSCTPAESVEVRITFVDGGLYAPLQPTLVRLHAPEREPRYLLRLDGQEQQFDSGMTVTFTPGQRVVIDAVTQGVASANPRPLP